MLRVATAALLIAALTGMRAAAGADSFKTADGMAVYLGVLRAELLLGHSPEHPEKQMHGGVPRGRGQHHIVIGLFDDKTGQRVTDAEITARVQEIGLGASTKKLERMSIDNTITYGRYFAMGAPGPYRIELSIRRAGARTPITASFDYSHPRR